MDKRYAARAPHGLQMLSLHRRESQCFALLGRSVQEVNKQGGSLLVEEANVVHVWSQHNTAVGAIESLRVVSCKLLRTYGRIYGRYVYRAKVRT